MKSPKKTKPVLPEGAFVLWATKLAEIISNRSGEAVPVELQTLIDKLKAGRISEESFSKQVKKLRQKTAI
jgi:hypothetical protein